MKTEDVKASDIRARYLLSFLMILVDRAGGELTIERLSEYAGRDVQLNMELQRDKDRVLLKTLYPGTHNGGKKPH